MKYMTQAMNHENIGTYLKSVLLRLFLKSRGVYLNLALMITLINLFIVFCIIWYSVSPDEVSRTMTQGKSRHMPLKEEKNRTLPISAMKNKLG